MSSSTALDSAWIDRIITAYRADAHVRQRLPDGGVVNIDRKLPFILVYRQPPGGNDAGTDRLLLGEASYVIARNGDAEELTELLRALAQAGTTELGSFLILELWADTGEEPRFAIHAPPGKRLGGVDTLRRSLEEASVQLDTEVVLLETDDRHPDDLPPLVDARTCFDLGCLLLGLEVPPIYRDAGTGVVYPVFLRRMRAALSSALRQCAWEFARLQTSAGFESYRALGPRRFDDAVFDVDRALSDIERSYSLLLLISPINSNEAWSAFRDGGFSQPPEFRYRLLPVDPDVLRRRLWSLDLDPVADPAMAFLLRDKREELDRQITLIAERNTPGFRYASIRLYQPVDDVLYNVAREILETVHTSGDSEDEPRELVSALEFARLARAELDYYRTILPELAADVQIRPDVIGLMVSEGNLLIGTRSAITTARADALLHHEIGTHVLTWYNGAAQPLRQLRSGLADYDELQEGLAVFAEYLVGGLNAARMRVLAARVVAAHAVEHGGEFMDTFRLLRDTHGFSSGTAFDIAERVHQCGGFTRDLIYLRGLVRLLEYVRGGGDLEPLYLGKIAAKHVDVIEELRARGFLAEPPLVPRLFSYPEVPQRLEAVRRGLPLTGLVSDG